MKKVLLALLLLFSFSMISGFNITRHSVEIELKENGHATVMEEYLLFFQNEYEKGEFERQSKKNGSSVLAWKAYEPKFFPHLGLDENDILKPNFSFEEAGDNRILKISYGLENQLFKQVEDTPRESKWTLETKELGSFVNGANLDIPADTTIEFVIPTGAKIKENITPEARVKGSTVTWNSSISSRLYFSYFLSKPITPLIDTSKLIQGIFSSTEGAVGIIGVLVLFLVVYWKRKAISGKIEDYVLEHSELELKENEEDIEIKV